MTIEKIAAVDPLLTSVSFETNFLFDTWAKQMESSPKKYLTYLCQKKLVADLSL